MPATRHLLRRLERAASRSSARLAAFALLALVATWPLLSTGAALNEFRDAHVLAHYEQVARETLLRYHQVPLWDPFYCGGMYLLGTPQSRFASPTLLLTLLFGEGRGEALAAFSMMVVGLEGAFRYARSRRASPLGAALAAPVFALSGVFAGVPSLGWVNFFGFELLPWAAYGVRLALRGRPLGYVFAAVALAWCVGFGGTYAAPMAALFCAFETLHAAVGQARSRRELLRVLGRAAVLVSLTLGLASFRLWPILDTLSAAPRIIGGTPGTPFATLLRMLFLRSDPADSVHTSDGAYYVGLLAIPAVLVGALRWRTLSLVVATYLAAWLAAGYALRPSLFAWLRELPVYTTLRYPERFLIVVALTGSVLAASGVTFARAASRLRRRRRRQAARILLAVLTLTLVADIVPLVRQCHTFASTRDLSPEPGSDLGLRPFHQARGTRWALAYYEPMNRGSLSCWEAYPVPQSPRLRADLAEEERLEDEAAGTLRVARWSPNRIDLDLALTRPGRVLVNQNWHGGWRASVGDVKSDRGLLVVDVPSGEHRVTLRFLPRSAVGGALVSAASVAGLIAIFFLGRIADARGRIAALAVVAALPAVVLAVSARLLEEPKGMEASGLLDDGSPAITDAPPPDARRLDVKLEGGLALDAARLSNAKPKPGEVITVEVDWRRAALAPSGLGVFVHIEPSRGEAVTADHVLLSSVLDLDQAPSGKTLRDVLPFRVPDDAKGTHFTIWVGLWRVRRGGERLKVADPGKGTIDQDRVLVATFDVE